MFDEITSILEQVAAMHHTTADEVRREISAALRESQVDPALDSDDVIALAAMQVLLTRPDTH